MGFVEVGGRRDLVLVTNPFLLGVAGSAIRMDLEVVDLFLQFVLTSLGAFPYQQTHDRNGGEKASLDDDDDDDDDKG